MQAVRSSQQAGSTPPTQRAHPRPQRVGNGIAYLAAAVVATALALVASGPLHFAVSSCAPTTMPLGPAFALALVVAASVLGNLPAVGEQTPLVFKAVAILPPLLLLFGYGAVMTFAAAVGAAAGRDGSWTLYVSVLMDVSPFLLLAGALVLGVIPLRPAGARLLACAGWVVLVLGGCAVAHLLRHTFGCGS